LRTLEIPDLRVIQEDIDRPISSLHVETLNTQIGFGYRIPEISHKDHAAYKLLETLLTGGGEGLLTYALTYDGLANTPIADIQGCSGGGHFFLYTEARDKNVQEVLNRIGGVIHALRSGNVRAEQLEHAKEGVRALFPRHMQKFVNFIGLHAETVLRRDNYTVNDFLRDIENVKVEDVVRATKIFQENNWALALRGRTKPTIVTMQFQKNIQTADLYPVSEKQLVSLFASPEQLLREAQRINVLSPEEKSNEMQTFSSSSGIRGMYIPFAGGYFLAQTAFDFDGLPADYQVHPEFLTLYLQTALEQTKRFPSKPSMEIFLRKAGGTIDFFTGDNYAGTVVTVNNSEAITKALEIIGETTFHATLDSAVLEIVKRKLIFSNEALSFNPVERAFTLLRQEFFLFQHGIDLIPETEQEARIQAVTSEQLIDFGSKMVTADNLRLYMSGNVPFSALEPVIEEFAGNYHSSQENPALRRKLSEPAKEIQRHVITEFQKGTNQATVLIGFRVGDLFNEYTPALEVVMQYLASRRESRLRAILREAGIIYNLVSRLRYDTHGGYFAIGTNVNPELTQKTIAMFSKEIIKLKNYELSEEDVARAQKGYIESLTDKLRNISRWATFHGERSIYKGGWADHVTAIKNVTPADIMNACNKYFTYENGAIVVTGVQQRKKFILPFS